MSPMLNRVALLLLVSTMSAGATYAQGLSAQGQPVQQPLPPATKLEGFKPAAGSVLTIGYDELGNVGGISVDVREMHDAKGASVRGLLVEVTESQYRDEKSFVDADEIPELLKGFDALLEVKANPTSFKSFEVRYTTRGGLELTAFNMANGNVLYAVQAGRTLKAQRVGLSTNDMLKLKTMFESAQQKLGTLPAK